MSTHIRVTLYLMFGILSVSVVLILLLAGLALQFGPDTVTPVQHAAIPAYTTYDHSNGGAVWLFLGAGGAFVFTAFALGLMADDLR